MIRVRRGLSKKDSGDFIFSIMYGSCTIQWWNNHVTMTGYGKGGMEDSGDFIVSSMHADSTVLCWYNHITMIGFGESGKGLGKGVANIPLNFE